MKFLQDAKRNAALRVSKLVYGSFSRSDQSDASGEICNTCNSINVGSITKISEFGGAQ